MQKKYHKTDHKSSGNTNTFSSDTHRGKTILQFRPVPVLCGEKFVFEIKIKKKDRRNNNKTYQIKAKEVNVQIATLGESNHKISFQNLQKKFFFALRIETYLAYELCVAPNSNVLSDGNINFCTIYRENKERETI